MAWTIFRCINFSRNNSAMSSMLASLRSCEPEGGSSNGIGNR